MKMIPDHTGRFRLRPHYEIGEIEELCERTLADFLEDLYGQVLVPVPTEALTILIERDAADLDLYADLSGEGADVQGVTEFAAGARPSVKIARELTLQRWRAHRLRTTLAHEYGHVLLHAPLWEEQGAGGPNRCRRGALLARDRVVDWLEWQAGYVSGALLMLRRRVALLVEAYLRERGARGLRDGSIEAAELRRRASVAFDVSEEAAGVRLMKLGHPPG
jgi:hypothetical protein